MRPGEASPREEATGGDPANAPDGESAEGPVDPLIGVTLAGKFQIEALLGAGAMGRVFRARQLTLDKPVAIKVLNASLAADPTFVARFAREARAAARLDHPNSIRVFDFGREPDGLFYIAMELVAGNDLATEMDDGPMRPDRIADILGQVLAALSVAHEMGVLHRDLKPANVLILRRKDDEGRPVDVAKVCDFGIAKIVGSSSEAGAERAGTHPLTAGLVVGTPEYMAPEQARGAQVDARADLYSVGVILYQMLTARVPFVCDTPLSTVIKHVTERPARPSVIHPDVDPTLEAICLRALEKAPDDRFQTASEMRLALLEAVRRPSAGSLPTVDAAADTPRSPAVEPAATASSVESGEPKGDDLRRATLGGVTPGQQAKRAPRAARWWMGLAGLAAVVVAGVVVGARLRHGRTESRPPAPPPSADESAAAAQPPPVVPAAHATIASASPSAEDPLVVKAVAPPVPAAPAAKPTRAKTVPAPEPPAKPAATAEPSVASAPPEPAAAPVQAPVIASSPPAPNEPPPPVATLPVAAPAPPRFDMAQARVLVQPTVRVSGATAGSVNRAVASAAAPLTACYRAALPQLSGPVDGDATLHIETDGAGTITDARLVGPLGQAIQSCAASAIIGRRIANVDTGSASADIPLAFRPR